MVVLAGLPETQVQMKAKDPHLPTDSRQPWLLPEGEAGVMPPGDRAPTLPCVEEVSSGGYTRGK